MNSTATFHLAMKCKESGDLERAEMYYTQAHFGGRLSLRLP